MLRYVIVLLALGSSFTLSSASGARSDAASPAAEQMRVAARLAPPVAIADVSPNRPYGEKLTDPGPNPGDTGGRIVGLVADPSHRNILYAATQWAGVWKSTDGGRSWGRPLTEGMTLRTGISRTWDGGHELAIDDTNPARLLYATDDDDLRATKRFGGLWVSSTGARTWTHAALPRCPKPQLGGLAFARGRAYVASTCGLASSANFSSWSFVGPKTSERPTQVVATRSDVFLCTQDKDLWHAPLSATGLGKWEGPVALPGTCSGLAAAPATMGRVYSITGGTDVRVTFTTFPGGSTRTILPAVPSSGCCGMLGVWAMASRSRGRIVGTDLYVSNKFSFFKFLPATHSRGAEWQVFPHLHADSWALAFPPGYDGTTRCTLFAATDGGVSTNGSGAASCDVARANWVRAENGLHAFSTFTMRGVSRPCAKGGTSSCPALYAPSADNDTWGYVGGSWQTGWFKLGHLGDSGQVFLDPVRPQEVAHTRNGQIELFTTGGPPPGPGAASQRIAPQGFNSGSAPPGSAGLTEVLTMPNESPPSGGSDYVAIQQISPHRGNRDRILRRRNGSRWFVVTPRQSFPARSVSAVAAGGGHTHTTVYLISNGTIYRATFGPSGVSSSARAWVKVSSGITSAFDIFVDPYNPRVAYVTDAGAGAIKKTTNGGQTWTQDVQLTRIGTNNGEFAVSCPNGGGSGGSFDQSCLLSDVVFLPRSHWRFAVTFPGGVAFSRNDGQGWIPLRGTIDPLDRPYSAFFDRFFTKTRVVTGRSLFVGLRGRGILRITADWAHLHLTQ